MDLWRRIGVVKETVTSLLVAEQLARVAVLLAMPVRRKQLSLDVQNTIRLTGAEQWQVAPVQKEAGKLDYMTPLSLASELVVH